MNQEFAKVHAMEEESPVDNDVSSGEIKQQICTQGSNKTTTTNVTLKGYKVLICLNNVHFEIMLVYCILKQITFKLF